MSYPFSMKVPDWLPSSMVMAGSWEDRLVVTYELYAQFTPKNDQDYADKKNKISTFRGNTTVYVYRPAI